MRLAVGLPHGNGQLIGAGGGLASTGVALEVSLNLIHGHAIDQLADGLEVTVAAANELYIGDYIVVQLEIDLRGADSIGAVRIIHVAIPFCN